MPNYIQPGSASTSGIAGNEDTNRAAGRGATVQPHQPNSSNGNPLALTHTSPLPLYNQPDTVARALLPGQLAGTWMGNSKNGPFEKS
jgi:hypothetical protein